MQNFDSTRESSFPAVDTTSQAILEEKITSRTASVGVIGLGYVGLPLCLHAAEAGFKLLGFDSDPAKVEQIMAGKSYVADVPSDSLAPLVFKGALTASATAGILRTADILIISVPTPLTPNQVPDMKFIRSATRIAADCLRPGMMVVLESTTYPGCTREELLPELERSGLKAGSDFWLAFSPERVDPGRGYDLTSTPKLVGGVTAACTRVASLFYSQFVSEVVPLSGPEVAEMAKLLENVYRSVNIALVNELAMICNKMNISVWETIDAAATKPFGFTAFYPGPGMGGHCIPIDPFYLSWKARELGLATEFVELAGKINTRMPHYVVDRVAAALNSRSKCLRGASILLIGAAYKSNVADLRESPAIRVTELLNDNGALVSYHDPHVSSFSTGDISFKSVPLEPALLSAADCVVVLTPHENIDWKMVGREAQLLVDTRNIVPFSGDKVFSI